jgi:hypothetical protein
VGVKCVGTWGDDQVVGAPILARSSMLILVLFCRERDHGAPTAKCFQTDGAVFL